MTTAITEYQEKQKALSVELGKLVPVMSRFAADGNDRAAIRIQTAIVAATYGNPKLLSCDIRSIQVAALQCAMYGLEPDTPLQLCHIIPYGNQAKLIQGYRGLIHLAHNAGEIAQIVGRVVHKEDAFSIRYTIEGTVMDHTPDPEAEPDSADYQGAYMWVKMRDPNIPPILHYMTKKEIDKRQKAAPGGSSGDSPWKKWPDTMRAKTVIKGGIRFIPLSPERMERFQLLNRAITEDSQVEAKGAAAIVPVDIKAALDAATDLDPTMAVSTPSGSKSDRMAKQMAPSAKPEPDPDPKNPPEPTKPDETAKLEDTGRVKLQEPSTVIAADVDDLKVPELKQIVSNAIPKMDVAYTTAIRLAVQEKCQCSTDVGKWNKEALAYAVALIKMNVVV